MGCAPARGSTWAHAAASRAKPQRRRATVRPRVSSYFAGLRRRWRDRGAARSVFDGRWSFWWQYPEVIKYPMDYGSIHTKLLQNGYETMEATPAFPGPSGGLTCCVCSATLCCRSGLSTCSWCSPMPRPAPRNATPTPSPTPQLCLRAVDLQSPGPPCPPVGLTTPRHLRQEAGAAQRQARDADLQATPTGPQRCSDG